MNDKGILLVIACPPADMEEEFNAWYDTEHLPERMAVPGFESGRRYVAASGARVYLAVYDLERPEVLDTPEYATVSGANFSPWTRRVTSRSRVYRAAGRQAHPGQALAKPCARLLLIRFRALSPGDEAAVVAGMRASFEGRPETVQVRVFAYPLESGAGTDFIGIVEARAPLSEQFDPAAFAGTADAIDMVETFMPR